MRIPTALRLSQWLTSHLQNLLDWTDLRTGQIHDPFESHQLDAYILAESYSPATALVSAAASCRHGQPLLAPLIPHYCRRILDLLASPKTPPFTALFLQYFGLMAVANLKVLATQPNAPMNSQEAEEFIRILCSYTDRLDKPINANCAAMQAGVQFLRQVHSSQADWDRCNERLAVVAAQQDESGFINDDLAGPSMPVAYHMFCMYLLAAAMARLDAGALDAAGSESMARATMIVTDGYGWLGHLLGNDGQFAQYGRSRYHAFAQAAGVALLAASGMGGEDAAVRRCLTWMDHYRLSLDGQDGQPRSIFAVTTNNCPPAMRVGFESYAMVTVYNNLAMAILLDASAWWSGELRELSSAAIARRSFLDGARQRGCFGHATTGLIRLRSQAGYVLVNLRTDPRSTTPLGSLLHLCLGDDLHEKASAPPFWAEPRVQADASPVSVWEGPLLCDHTPESCSLAAIPPFVMQGRTLQCQSTPSSILLRCSGPGADWSKCIRMEPGRLEVHWQIQPNAAGQKLSAAVSCLLWDGVAQTHMWFDGPRIRATLAGASWQMTILDGKGQPLPGDWLLTSLRSTLSVSGVTGRLLFPLRETAGADASFEWTLRIETLK